MDEVTNQIPTFTINENIWWLALCILASVFCIHAIVVMYHWFTYGTEKSTPLFASIIYLSVGLFILLTMTITLLI